MSFTLPHDAAEFVDRIFDRCHILINCGLWGNTDIDRFRLWWRNFQDLPEQYLAAHIADSIVYRSWPMIESYFDHIVDTVIAPIVCELAGKATDIESAWKVLRSNQNLPLRFISVEHPRKGEVANSSTEMIRHFHNHTRIPKTRSLSAHRLRTLPKNVEVVIFLDDLLCTGTQFIETMQSLDLDNLRVIYIPLAAYSDGIAKVREQMERVELRPVEELDARHSFFRKADWLDDHNSMDEAREFYLQIFSSRSIPLKLPLGYGKLGLTYATEITTPNNCLGVLFSDARGAWEPLFDRAR